MPDKTSDRLPLTLEQYSQEKKLPLDYLVRTWGLKTTVHGGVVCVEQPYTRIDGTVCAPRYRYANAKQSPYQSGDRIVLYGQGQLVSKVSEELPSIPPVLWGDPSLREESYLSPCILVEGESDTQTLHYARFNVLGIPGTSMWDKCIANDPGILKYLENRTILVIQEPPSLAEKAKGLDSPAKMVMNVKKSLPNTKVVPIKLWEFAPRDSDGDPLYKDVSGLWLYHGGLPDFIDALHIASRAAGRRGSGGRRIHSVRASDIEMELTEWLWKDHIPLKHVTVFAGMPQKGKSTAALDVTSRLTTGNNFPFMENTLEPCDVAILASEDNPATTTVPRLFAAKADMSKVHVVKGSVIGGKVQDVWGIDLEKDQELLKTFIQENPNIKLLVIDPVTSYIGDVDPNKPKEVRPFLNKLVAFATEMNISLLLIMHLSKNPDVSALHRVGGAATWIEVPRSVWFFDVKQQEEGSTAPPSYVMVNGKLNLVADDRKKSLEYAFVGVNVEIKDTLESIGTIRWGGESSITLEQQYARHKGKTGPTAERMPAAKRWLEEYLKDGPRPSAELEKEGIAAGHAKWTLKDAKKELRIKTYPRDGVYVSALPVKDVLGNDVEGGLG
jgi:putative DNA primase/helicase